MSHDHWSQGPSVRDYYEALSEGYLRLSLSKALHRYISLPSMFDQSAQLVPRAGSDTMRLFVLELPLLRNHWHRWWAWMASRGPVALILVTLSWFVRGFQMLYYIQLSNSRGFLSLLNWTMVVRCGNNLWRIVSRNCKIRGTSICLWPFVVAAILVLPLT